MATWDPLHDQRLIDAVETYGPRWKWIALCLFAETGLSDDAVRNRYQRILDLEWEDEDDELLLDAVAIHGLRWDVISRLVFSSDVTPRQLSWRYARLTNCDGRSRSGGSTVRRIWTAEDDALLLSAVIAHHRCWRDVMTCFPGRARNSVRNRWSRIVLRCCQRGEVRTSNEVGVIVAEFGMLPSDGRGARAALRASRP